jgi:hypothetical protein
MGLAIPLLGIYPKKEKYFFIQKCVYERPQKHKHNYPKEECPSNDVWLNKIWYIHLGGALFGHKKRKEMV